MVVKLSKGKVDENVVKLILESISDLEQRLRRVEKQIDALIQEIYGFKILDDGESKVKERAVMREEAGAENGELAENGGGIRTSAEAEMEGLKMEELKKERGRIIIPKVKLAS